MRTTPQLSVHIWDIRKSMGSGAGGGRGLEIVLSRSVCLALVLVLTPGQRQLQSFLQLSGVGSYYAGLKFYRTVGSLFSCIVFGGSAEIRINFRGRRTCQRPTIGVIFHSSIQIVFLIISTTPVLVVQL